MSELHKVSKIPVDECEKEFDQALDLLFNLANLDDKFCEPAKVKRFFFFLLFKLKNIYNMIKISSSKCNFHSVKVFVFFQPANSC